MMALPPLSKFPSMFFHASGYRCGHEDFIHFSKLVREGYGDMPYDVVMKALSCAKCSNKDLSVTVHGAGVNA